MDRYQYNIRVNDLDIPESKLYNKLLTENNIDFITQRILSDRQKPVITEPGNYNRDVIFYFLTKTDAVQAKMLFPC